MKKLINKQIIAEKYQLKYNGSKTNAKEVVDFIFNLLQEGLVAGSKVSIAKFGVFENRHMKKRKAINPNTRKTIEVPARNKISFRTSVPFKKVINNK